MNTLIEKRYHFISRSSEVILIVGFIVDFCMRREIFSIEQREYTLIPFVINIILLLIAAKYTYDLKESQDHFKRVINVGVKLLLNATLMLLIIWVPDKL